MIKQINALIWSIIFVSLICVCINYIYNYRRRSYLLMEGFTDEPTKPVDISDALNKVRDHNAAIKENLFIEKNRKKYEEYLIELYNHVNIKTLNECLKQDVPINEKIKNLHKIDTHYKPIKEMLNDTLKYMDTI